MAASNLAHNSAFFASSMTPDKSFLIYSTEDQNWTNIDFNKLCFVGATDNSNGIAGFVPAPEIGQTNLFLRSDGKWISIETEKLNPNVDSFSIDIYDDN